MPKLYPTMNMNSLCMRNDFAPSEGVSCTRVLSFSIATTFMLLPEPFKFSFCPGFFTRAAAFSFSGPGLGNYNLTIDKE